MSYVMSFPLSTSAFQSTVMCYRGPGCTTYRYVTETYPESFDTLADAQLFATTNFRNKCQEVFVDNLLVTTPFGNMAGGCPAGGGFCSERSGYTTICSGIVGGDNVNGCPIGSLWMVHMEGVDGTLRVDTDYLALFVARQGACPNSIQIIDGENCRWYGTHVECDGTSATLAIVPDSSLCCGDIDDPLNTICENTSTPAGDENCPDPPRGFETDPSCDVYSRSNSNVPRFPIVSSGSLDGSCSDYTASPPTRSPTRSPTRQPTPTPTEISLEPSTSFGPTESPTESIFPTESPQPSTSGQPSSVPTTSPIGEDSTIQPSCITAACRAANKVRTNNELPTEQSSTTEQASLSSSTADITVVPLSVTAPLLLFLIPSLTDLLV